MVTINTSWEQYKLAKQKEARQSRGQHTGLPVDQTTFRKLQALVLPKRS